MVAWAKAQGMTVMMHTGGTSIPGSSVVGAAKDILKVKPSVVSHINGGPTAVSLEGAKADRGKIRRRHRDRAVRQHLPRCKWPISSAERANGAGMIFGNDAPSGTGVVTWASCATWP
jgi:enamidase